MLIALCWWALVVIVDLMFLFVCAWQKTYNPNIQFGKVDYDGIPLSIIIWFGVGVLVFYILIVLSYHFVKNGADSTSFWNILYNKGNEEVRTWEDIRDVP